MNKDEWIKQLESEGYSDIQEHTFPAGHILPEHTHEQATANVILAGEATVRDTDGTITYAAGDRFDLPANTTHVAEFGPDGCTFLAGTK